MKVTKEAIETVLVFVGKNPNAYQASIQKGTGLSEAIVRESLNQLKADTKVVGTKVGLRVEYVVATPAKATPVAKTKTTPVAKAKTKTPAKATPVAKAKTKTPAKVKTKATPVAKVKVVPITKSTDAKVAVTYVVQPGEPKTSKETGRNYGRNFNRFVLNGQSYQKGKLVHAIVADYVKEKNATLTELKSVFADKLNKSYGVFQEINVAKEKPGRYFTNKSITLSGGKRIAVCNQWTTENIQPVLAVAKSLGYKITAETDVVAK